MTQMIKSAAAQFFSRPADQEFDSLDSLLTFLRMREDRLHRLDCHYSDIATALPGLQGADPLEVRAPAAPGIVYPDAPDGTVVPFSPWAFSQFCQRISAPADYLRKLPPQLMQDCLASSLAARTKSYNSGLQVFGLESSNGGGREIRAIVSDRYVRIPDVEILGQIWSIGGDILKPGGDLAGKTTASGAAGINAGTQAHRSGLYASDRDTFAFLVNPEALEGPGGTPMYRGCIASNSEVGNGSIGVLFFYFDAVCANHYIWGAEVLETVKQRHVGRKAEEAPARIRHLVETWLAVSTVDFEKDLALMALARGITFADGPVEQVEKLRKRGFTKAEAEGGSVHAHEDDHAGEPLSVMGTVAGLTRYAQEVEHVGERTTLEVKAGRLLEVVRS